MRIFFLVGACCSAIFAQQGITSNGGFLQTGAAIFGQQIVTANGTVLQRRSASGTVAGAPYSAEQVIEHKQTLADGTHITQMPTVTKMYRDSRGRTRTERTIMGSAEGRAIIEILDPIGRYRYRLDTGKHVAHRGRTAGSQALQFFPADPGARPPLPPPAAPAAAQNGSVALAGNSSQRTRPEITNESLGTQVINGVIAEGRRTTITYGVGTMGNDREIVATHETWTSPELHVTLLATNHDPRMGDNTTRIENLSRAEPDPSLFQVPPDYEVVDDPEPTPVPVKQP